MRITTIGSWGAYPEKNEATAAYLIQEDKKNILIDCGSGVVSQLQNYIKLEELDCVILTHYHADHIADIYPLQYACMILSQTGKRSKPLRIYAHSRDKKEFDSLSYGNYCEAISIDTGNDLTIGNLNFTFSENVHPAYCLSIRVQCQDSIFTYVSDTGWTDKLVHISKDADILICETNLYNEQFGVVVGHLTAGEVGRLALEAGVKKLILNHLPHYGDLSQLLNQAQTFFNGSVEIAKSGAIWTL
ncbi:MAG: MBL fold metallo-hydrolase [Bacillota bacterium]|nr:MBL fold metallo-hydrolase [Bacillota bacterium]